jgi:hypothetical protein
VQNLLKMNIFCFLGDCTVMQKKSAGRSRRYLMHSLTQKYFTA